MRRGKAAISILNLVQVLDQEIATPWFIAEQGKDIFARVPVDLAPFWRRTHSGTRRFSTHIHRNAIIGTVCSLTMRVEFLGVPRQRAGISQLELQADTLAQLLGKLSAQIPY